ncbi:sulfate transporter [Prauserella muralis]|uniref:Sulfate transporter n=1 Tax=Prauserella muralis TaxID=588067 RepID=A0A2V4AQM0_9PSEU|nr:sulfate transporter [Prauserella muralis]
MTRWLPGLVQYRGYRRAWLRGDLLAGVTVAAYLVPQVMAYADVAGLPPVAGLWAVVGPLAVYGLIGSSRQLSVGPESTTALMTAVALAPLAAGDPARYGALATLLALLVGVLCLLGALARLGFLADLLSRPVLVGYLTGIAGMMIVSQLGTVTGVPVSGDGFLPELGSFLAGVHRVHWQTLALAAGVLALLLVLARLVPRSPGPLVGILAATVVVAAFSLRQAGIAVVGEVPRGLPVPGLPELALGDLAELLLPAVGIAIVGFSDNVLTARAFGSRRGETVNANQEFAALGVANVTSALLRGFPVSSSGSRTVLGDAVGSRTQLHALAALAMVLLTLLVAGPVLAAFPTAALGAIVVYAALRLVDVGEFTRIARFRRSELLLALATTAAVLGLGVLYGVLAAVGLSILDLLRRVARPHDGILGYVQGVAGMHDVDDYPSARWVPGLVIYRYDAPLCFVNAEDFRRRALQSLEVPGGDVEWLLLNVEAMVGVDSTGIEALRALHAELRERGVTLALARVKQDLRDDLSRAGLVAEIGQDRLFLTLPTAVVTYLREYAARHGRLPDGVVLPEPSTQAVRPRDVSG